MGCCSKYKVILYFTELFYKMSFTNSPFFKFIIQRDYNKFKDKSDIKAAKELKD